MARPEKLDIEIQKEIINMVKAGNFLETAAAFAGVDVSTIRRWIKRGERELQRIDENSGGRAKIRKAEQKYVEFCTAIKKAKAESEIRDLLLIGNAAKEDWKAAAWRLERKYPERYGRTERHELTGKDGGPIEVDEVSEKLIKKLTNLSQSKEDE